jgi:hypothetical protein
VEPPEPTADNGEATPDARDAPAPVAVDLRRVALVGTAMWLVGALATLVVGLTVGRWVPFAVCVVGALLGLLMARWARSHDGIGRRLPAARTQDEASSES